MIESLHISNYALIENIDIVFDRGLNIITGETGAGKSIILDALGLVMGERADMSAKRNAEAKTVVEAVFDISGLDDINGYLEANDLDTNPGQVILRRELTRGGGSRAFVNDTPVRLDQLREVSVRLLDIHSQHQNLLLADPAFQLSVLDAVAGNEALAARYREAYTAYRAALGKYRRTEDMLRRNRSEEEYLSFQLRQLDELALKEGEQEQLEKERRLLADAGQIKESVGQAIGALTDGASVSEALTRAGAVLQHLEDVYSEAAEMSERLEAARLEIDDVIESLSRFEYGLKADPAALEEIEERLSAIYSLETKHHVDDDKGLIALREQLREQLATIASGDEALSELETAAKKAKKEAVLLARELSEKRKVAAVDLAKRLQERARPLGMSNLRCEIAVNQDKLSPSGIDKVDYLFAFNKNSAPLPVGKTASGGEISRVMLALKSLIAEQMHLPTLIFDEVDTGVSGDIAGRIGLMMTDMARHAQLITITHLPQVAARGSRHLKVFKRDNELATLTEIKVLDNEGRRAELALMLSGDATDATALAAADTLLKSKTN